MGDIGGGIGAIGILLILGVIVLGLAALIFWIWSLIDCATKETDQGNNKLIWILIIIFAGVIGSLIYYFARRPQRIAQFGR